jgi:putative ABC transport system substrate-binding protein
VKRREFITLLGGAAGWSLAARAQQPAMPVIGYLSGRSPGESAHIVTAFRQGLKEAGFVDGQNVAIESRFAEGNFDRLSALATELVRRQVNVIATAGGTVTGSQGQAGRADDSIELLHELVPKATVIGCLVNPKDPNADSDTKEAQVAADALGQKLVVGKASTETEIDLAFESFVQTAGRSAIR